MCTNKGEYTIYIIIFDFSYGWFITNRKSYQAFDVELLPAAREGGMNDAMEWDLKSFSYDRTFGHFSRMLFHVKDRILDLLPGFCLVLE